MSDNGYDSPDYEVDNDPYDDYDGDGEYEETHQERNDHLDFEDYTVMEQLNIEYEQAEQAAQDHENAAEIQDVEEQQALAEYEQQLQDEYDQEQLDDMDLQEVQLEEDRYKQQADELRDMNDAQDQDEIDLSDALNHLGHGDPADEQSDEIEVGPETEDDRSAAERDYDDYQAEQQRDFDDYPPDDDDYGLQEEHGYDDYQPDEEPDYDDYDDYDPAEQPDFDDYDLDEDYRPTRAVPPAAPAGPPLPPPADPMRPDATCAICLGALSDTVLIPCGHLVACAVMPHLPSPP